MATKRTEVRVAKTVQEEKEKIFVVFLWFVFVVLVATYVLLVSCTPIRMGYDAIMNLDNEKILAYVCTVTKIHDDTRLQVVTFDVAFIGRSCLDDTFEVRIPFSLSRVVKNARKLQLGEHVKLNGETVNISNGEDPDLDHVVFMARSIRD